ncbi:MAG: hypothetical protein A2173_09990 [Planctomycetes bacterium RBG_13_44_8b]|nr:MAG: hypothetical protein A2173_09990 [Planctomycetes bacterium RBG_13_44_8b]
METKKDNRPPLISKATIEFIIIISAAVLLFVIISGLGIIDKLHQTAAEKHKLTDELMFAATFLAAGLMVFSFRRWLELRKTHKELTKSEEQLRFQATLLDEIGDCVTGTDLEGKITYVNKAKCDMMQKDQQDFIGQSVKAYGDSEVIGANQEEIVDITLKEGKWSGEVINTASDGSKITVDLHTWLLKDKNGRPTGMCGVSRNITEKKEQTQELAKHRRYLEALDAAAGILLHSISEIKYEEFITALGPACGADRIIIFLIKTDQNGNITIYPQAQWYAEEKLKYIKPENIDYFMMNIWPRWKKILSAGKSICSLVADFPAEDQPFWKSMGLKVVSALPIIIDGRLEGFIGFDNCTDERQWTESELGFLHTAANNLAIAIKRLDTKEELRGQKDFAEGLIETAQTIILVLDKDANIVTFNPYFEKLSGYKLDEVKGKNWFDTFLPAQDRPRIHHLFETTMKNISTKGNINPIVTKDGQLRYIEWFDKTLKDVSGQTTALLSTGQDITERLKAEQELKDSEARLKTIFEDALDGIIVADIETRKFHICNKSICHMLGYSEEEMLQLGVEDIHPAKDWPEVMKVFEKQARGDFKLGEALPIERKDGSIFYADINTSPVILDGKKYLMGSFRDITERREAQEELKKAHLELEQRVIQRTAALQETNARLIKTIEERDRIQKILQETEKLAGAGKLAAQIAHEINNPLAGIKNSFLLVKDAIPPNHQYFKYVGRIEKEIDRVSQTVRQMFDLYRPDAAPAEQFRLSDTINDIVELLEVALEEKHINIEIQCSDNIIVRLSEALLRQVIYNIVQNAIQASGANTTIKILASADNGKINLAISDQGSGIDEKIRDKIFEPFFTTGRGGPKSGLGLGLAITKDIINAVNGTINFTSEKDKGTVFNISIPT